jgi:hypothetical protein
MNNNYIKIMKPLPLELISKILEYNFDIDQDWNIIINDKNRIVSRFNMNSRFSRKLSHTIMITNNYIKKRLNEYENYYGSIIPNYKNSDSYNVIFGLLFFSKNVIEAIKILDFLEAYSL